MNSLSVFQFEGTEVRFVGTPEKPEWVAADVCRILDIKNAADALASFKAKEKGIATIYTLGGSQEVLTVTEPGLYRLIFKSRKPVAERFQDWVFHEVLPTIRRTGKYEVGQPPQQPQPLDVQNTLTLLNTLLDPLTSKGVDVALIQSAKISAIALQHPEYQRLLTAVKEELTLLTLDDDRRYNPTRLGELYAQRHQLEKPVSARAINQALQKAQFQVPEYRTNSKGKRVFDWKLTQLGEQYGKVFLESAQGSNKTITVIRWLPSVLNAIACEILIPGGSND